LIFEVRERMLNMKQLMFIQKILSFRIKD